MIAPGSSSIPLQPFDITGPSKPGPSSRSNPTDSAEEKKLKKAAGDFEAILLDEMWKSAKNSFGTSETDGSDAAHGTLEDWGMEVMSGAVGKAGGLGIGALILRHLAATPPPQSNSGANVSNGSADKVK